MGTFKAGDKVTGIEISHYPGRSHRPRAMQDCEYGIVRDGVDDSNVQVWNQDKSDWFPYVASDLKLYKEKEMTKFKKGDLVQYGGRSGEKRVGIFDRLEGSSMAYAFWGDTLDEAKQRQETGKSTWVHVDRVSKYIRELKDVQEGDKVIRSGYEKEVVSVSNGYVVTSDIYDGSGDLNAYTLAEFVESGFSFTEEPAEEEVKEVTLSEIADKFNIDVEKLRIKE